MRKEIRFTVYLYAAIAVAAFFGSLGFGVAYFTSEHVNGLLDARAAAYTRTYAYARYARPGASGGVTDGTQAAAWVISAVFLALCVALLRAGRRSRTIQFTTGAGDVRFVRVRTRRASPTFALDLAEFVSQSSVRGLTRKAWIGDVGRAQYRFRSGALCTRSYYEKLVKTLRDAGWVSVSRRGTELLGTVAEVLDAYDLRSVQWK